MVGGAGGVAPPLICKKLSKSGLSAQHGRFELHTAKYREFQFRRHPPQAWWRCTFSPLIRNNSRPVRIFCSLVHWRVSRGLYHQIWLLTKSFVSVRSRPSLWGELVDKKESSRFGLFIHIQPTTCFTHNAEWKLVKYSQNQKHKEVENVQTYPFSSVFTCNALHRPANNEILISQNK